MKLVLIYEYCTDECSGRFTIPFEYESKEKFVFDILEKYKDKEWKQWGNDYWTQYEEVLLYPNGISLNKYDIESIEYNVYTLEEWFENEKVKMIL